MPDLLARVREAARTNLYWRFLGIELEDAGEGWVRLRVPVRDELKNRAVGRLHGGVYSSLVDGAVGAARMTLSEQGQATLDLNVSFLASVSEGDIFAVGRATYMIIEPRA